MEGGRLCEDGWEDGGDGWRVCGWIDRWVDGGRTDGETEAQKGEMTCLR